MKRKLNSIQRQILIQNKLKEIKWKKQLEEERELLEVERAFQEPEIKIETYEEYLARGGRVKKCPYREPQHLKQDKIKIRRGIKKRSGEKRSDF